MQIFYFCKHYKNCIFIYLYSICSYHQKYLLRCEKELFSSLQLTDEEVIKSYVAAKLNGYAAGYGSMEQFEKEVPKWQLNDDQIKLAKKTILEKDGKPQGCGI